MDFGLIDGGEDDEYTGIDSVEISKIFAMHTAGFLGTELFDRG